MTTFEALKARVRELERQLSRGDRYKCLICMVSSTPVVVMNQKMSWSRGPVSVEVGRIVLISWKGSAPLCLPKAEPLTSALSTCMTSFSAHSFPFAAHAVAQVIPMHPRDHKTLASPLSLAVQGSPMSSLLGRAALVWR